MAKMKTHFLWSTSIIKQNINNEAGTRGLVQMGMAIWCWKDYREADHKQKKNCLFSGADKMTGETRKRSNLAQTPISLLLDQV